MTRGADLDPPTFVSPGGVTWRVHLDRAMWIAGVRGLMLQTLHPAAMSGVWQRSDFQTDPTGRLLRTADFVATMTYGSAGEVADLGARVRRIHSRLSFVDPVMGAERRVDDPELLLWVHCAEVVSYLEVTRRAGLALSRADADAYFAEQRLTAAQVGLDPGVVPGSVEEMRRYLAGVRRRLRVTPEARAAIRFLLWPALPERLRWLNPAKPLWWPLGALAYFSLPVFARRMLGVLPEGPGVEAATTVGLRGVRAVLERTPNRWYNRLFDEATVLRAERARERLESVGYEFPSGRGLRDPRDPR